MRTSVRVPSGPVDSGRPTGQARVPWVPATTFVVAMGTAWHFVHELSGRVWLVGLVAPVNESVWEHAKLLAMPLLVVGVVLAVRNRGSAGLMLAGAVTGSAVACAAMIAGFYGYVAITGTHLLVLDLILFVVCALLGVATMAWVVGSGAHVPLWLGAGLACAVLALFAVLTQWPPDLPPFR
jgi:hypothetical protein